MNQKIRDQQIDLLDFVPSHSINVKNGRKYPVEVIKDDHYLSLGYDTPLHNHTGLCSQKRYITLIPRFIKSNQGTFEVLGLLQAEMGKKHDGKIVFCNHEYKLVNKVVKWFETQLNFSKDKWKWYIKVNINEPFDKNYKKEIEDKVIDHWIEKTCLSLEKSYPKKVGYIKNTNNKKLRLYDYGTLIIEAKCNLFSQITKSFVKKMTQNILNFGEDGIRDFMRGIIAGESNVEIHIKDKRFRVFITAKESSERFLFANCLRKLGVDSVCKESYKSLIISKKENLLELLKQRLVTLSPKKYNKFLRIFRLYEDFDGLVEWRKNLQKPHNKIPQENIDRIIELHNEHPDWPSWKITELVGVSDVKVCRVRKELKKMNESFKKDPKSLIPILIKGVQK